MTKERQSRSYRLSAYYLASSFSQMPILCVLPTINITIIYFMVGLPYRYGAASVARAAPTNAGL